MRKFVARGGHVRFKATYPLIEIEQLRNGKSFNVGETGTLALRDYFEWRALPSIMRHETFFTQRNKLLDQVTNSTERLSLYDPILTHCIAKWLLVDYKLNSYPYSDLNIINIYTNLPQSLRIAKSMMSYFQLVLSEDMFERIKYIMVPLHSHQKRPSTKLTSGIPGKVQIVHDRAVFSSQVSNKYNPRPFVIEDPVYFLMLDDVLKNTSHDLVKYNQEAGKWEQCYVDIDEHGRRTRRFDSEMDYWCQIALKRALKEHDPSATAKTEGVLIPTRLIQLFELLKECAPAHKLFAIDTPQRWDPSFFSMIKLLLGHKPLRASQILEPERSSIWSGRRDDHAPRFAIDFAQAQQLYMSINENNRLCEVKDMSEFVDQWFDARSDVMGELTKDKLNSQLEVIDGSLLAILHSS
ncbi:type II protein arginine methyltransferase TDEL_0B02770 [Torulaspora delbrueckii]|uniref:type II protein arginine methyltransferase n=1 Tax=Torulaspora delbrueckii TaxID=4950 RepID=G8ZP62_TORDE|nr:hypothetical protein TDEL_0B02770 [Torulaspora delbrueckii]CCE90406.1 hypothetical protein TDEL_0B02770 [Torulaspora delbrueckii]